MRKPKNSLRNNLVEAIEAMIIGIGIGSMFPLWLFYKEELWGIVIIISIILCLIIDRIFIDRKVQKRYLKECKRYYEDEED